MTKQILPLPSPVSLERFATLMDILTYRRPHGSASEEACIAKYLDTIPGMTVDAFGNRILDVGCPSGNRKPTTLFSCHTDTVHRTPGVQKILFDESLNVIYVPQTSEGGLSLSEPLGADDGAGWWLLLQMIGAEIPGRYVFHRAEERGGQGSDYIATSTPELLEGIKRAVAFDRKGTKDIITHQAYGECCSQAFAKALAEQLGMGHKPSSRGVFTDTANYVDYIPECTNVSIGYEHEHTVMEMLDLDYLGRLATSLLTVDWDALPTVRDPLAYDAYDGTGWHKDEDIYDELCNEEPWVAAELLRMLKPSEWEIKEAHLRAGYPYPRDSWGPYDRADRKEY